jgi:hypothetical protein
MTRYWYLATKSIHVREVRPNDVHDSLDGSYIIRTMHTMDINFLYEFAQTTRRKPGEWFAVRKVSRCRVVPSSAGNVFVPSVVVAELRKPTNNVFSKLKRPTGSSSSFPLLSEIEQAKTSTRQSFKLFSRSAGLVLVIIPRASPHLLDKVGFEVHPHAPLHPFLSQQRQTPLRDDDPI